MPKKGDPAIDFKYADKDGNEFSLSSFNGNLIYVADLNIRLGVYSHILLFHPTHFCYFFLFFQIYSRKLKEEQSELIR